MSRILNRATQITKQMASSQSRGIASAASIPSFKLNTGAKIPGLGFGTWQDKDAQEPAVIAALKSGYRHIDTARIYGTEQAVGNAIKHSGVPRDEIFITTKLWNHKHHPDDVEAALDASLKDLQIDSVDLFLIHWPVAFKRGESPFPKENDKTQTDKSIDYLDTWKALEAVYKSGKAKAIGISNFSKAELERLLSHAKVQPAVHQLELHPYLQQYDFLEWHKSKGIHVTAYSPFGNANPIYDKGKDVPQLIEDPTLVEIGKKYGKSGAQVALRWGLARGHSVVPKSKTESRIQQNGELDFELTEEDIQKIAKIDKKLRLNDPSANFGWDFYTDLEGKE